MSELVSLNHQIQPRDQAVVGAASASLLYGRSVFTTVALRSCKPLFWPKHERRLIDHAFRLGIEVAAVDFERVAEDVRRLAELNVHNDGRARVTIGERGGGIWSSEKERRFDLFIMTAGRHSSHEPVRLMPSPFIVNTSSPLAGLKCGNYLEPLAALNDAKRRGFDEVFRTNERGEIVSAALANIFWIREGELFTPSLDTGCLAGTTREFVIETHPVNEVRRPAIELQTAEGVFLTSAGIGVCTATCDATTSTADEIIAKVQKSLERVGMVE